MTSPYRKSSEAAKLPPEPLPSTVVTMPAPGGAERAVNDRQQNRPQALEKIGEILQREREKLGGDLQQIADYLRIRRSFLDALEQSRYDEFPADAYVVGFLRSYAEHLGLNAKQVIDHYRREMAGRRKKPQLSMPIPISEGRAPSAIILAGAAVAALVAYIGWYAFSSSDRAAVSVPPAIPAAADAGGDAAPAAAGTTDIVLPVTAAAAMPDPTFGGAKAPPVDVKAAKADAAREEAKAAEAPQSDAPPAAAAVAAPAPATVAEPPAAAKPAPAPKDDAATLNAAEAAKLNAKPAAAAPVPAAAPQHLSVTVEEASWVLITDRGGQTVFDKIMQPGETYSIPSQPGLRLTTGNGAQVRLVLDGKTLPPLSTSSAQILRKIPLDANTLNNLPLKDAAGE